MGSVGRIDSMMADSDDPGSACSSGLGSPGRRILASGSGATTARTGAGTGASVTSVSSCLWLSRLWSGESGRVDASVSGTAPCESPAASITSGGGTIVDGGRMKSIGPNDSSARPTSAERSRRWRNTDRPAGDISGSIAIHSSVDSSAMRSTGAEIARSSSANSRTSGAGGRAKANARALAARIVAGTCGRIDRNRVIAMSLAGARPRPIRSTSCRHAVCAPKGVDISAVKTVSRLSSNRKSRGLPPTHENAW